MGTMVAIERRRRVSVPARVVLLTLLLGGTVVISWLGVRGLSVFRGPGRFLDETWVVIWAVQALLAFGLVLGVEWVRPSVTRRVMAGTVLAAWVGELVVAALVGPFLAGELEVWNAPWLWLIATGFIVQPLAAIAGGLAAHRRRP